MSSGLMEEGLAACSTTYRGNKKKSFI